MIFFSQNTTIGTVVFSSVDVTDDDADGSDAVDGPILFSLLDSLQVIRLLNFMAFTKRLTLKWFFVSFWFCFIFVCLFFFKRIPLKCPISFRVGGLSNMSNISAVHMHDERFQNYPFTDLPL